MRLPINGQINDATPNPVNIHEIRCLFRLNCDAAPRSKISKYLRLTRLSGYGDYHGIAADLDNLNTAHTIGGCDGAVLGYARLREHGYIAIGLIHSEGGGRRLRSEIIDLLLEPGYFGIAPGYFEIARANQYLNSNSPSCPDDRSTNEDKRDKPVLLN